MTYNDESGIRKTEPICARCYPKSVSLLNKERGKFPAGLPNVKVMEIQNCLKTEDACRTVDVPKQEEVVNIPDKSKDDMKRDLVSKLKLAHKRNEENNK